MYFICTRLKALIFGILSIFNRALCCLQRKRRPSFDDCEILSSINVHSDSHRNDRRKDIDRDWNSWDDSPRTVAEHIEQFRQKLAQTKVPQEPEPNIDFFGDMEPEIKRQQKILISTDEQKPMEFSRLQPISGDVPVTVELENWSDNEDPSTGWNELDSQQTKEMLREKRREMRAQKLKQHNTKHIPSQIGERIGGNPQSSYKINL